MAKKSRLVLTRSRRRVIVRRRNRCHVTDGIMPSHHSTARVWIFSRDRRKVKILPSMRKFCAVLLTSALSKMWIILKIAIAKSSPIASEHLCNILKLWFEVISIFDKERNPCAILTEQNMISDGILWKLWDWEWVLHKLLHNFVV